MVRFSLIETSLSKGKAGKLTLTGNLGDVMKESAVIALEYVKAHISALNVDYRIFEQWNIHIHVPEGATPRMVLQLVSPLQQVLLQHSHSVRLRKNNCYDGRDNLTW